jgi:sigma-B regulation protein RsbQ
MPVDIVKKNNVAVKNENGKETIVFAHGFGTDQTAWEQVAAAFIDDYKLVLYDNVGAGQSDPAAFSPNKYDTLQSYANDLVDICKGLNLKDAVMVGHSVSGMISLLAAVKEPGMFKKMILVGASPRYLDDAGYTGGFTQEALDQLYAAMANNYYAWVSGFAPMVMENPDKPELAESFAHSLASIRPDIAQSVARVIFQSDHRQDLPKVNVETLLLQTQHDNAVPGEVALYLNRHIPNSTLVQVNAEGHFPHISAPDEIIREIKKFIES